jgi:ribosomal protein S18 acetylase RimI-like enzyme
MAATTIRPLTIRDYPAVLRLWRATPGIGLDDDSDSRAAIGRYLRRNPNLSFVACHNRQLVGAVLSGHDGRRGYLHHLAVLPALRRHGIGSALVNRCLRGLAKANISRCNIFVRGDNPQGLAFWKRRGWTLRAETPWLQIRTPAKPRRRTG